jgi:hypothetical protein
MTNFFISTSLSPPRHEAAFTRGAMARYFIYSLKKLVAHYPAVKDVFGIMLKKGASEGLTPALVPLLFELACID